MSGFPVTRTISQDPNSELRFEDEYKTLDGVRKVQGLKRVWGPKSKLCLFIGLVIVCYIYSLDGMTSYLYLAQATSSFSEHSKLGAIATAQAVIIAVFKPVAAKVADTFGRAEAFTLSVLFYVIGYIVVATCKTFDHYAAGQIIYYAGYASLQILIVIVIGDFTTLKYRGLCTSLYSLPFIINFGVASNIAANIIENSSWRWGYGMLLIVVAGGSSVIIVTLFWAQFRAKRLGLIATEYQLNGPDTGTQRAGPASDKTILQRLWAYLLELDVFGLILFAAGWTCLLLPMTLINTGRGGKNWSDADMVAMLVVGGVILVILVLFETLVAPTPVFPLRYFANFTVIACALIGFFDFVSFYMQYTFQYSFIFVTKDWSLRDQNYFAYTQSLCLTIFAITAGFIQLWTRRTKWLLVVGLCIRLLGVGLMIRSKGALGSTFELVIAQVLQGMGGGIAACTTQLVAQALLPHQDLASVTALVLLFSEVGNAVGTAIATAIWRNKMPGYLERHLANILSVDEIQRIFGSINDAVTYRTSNPAAYAGIIDAYTDTMKLLLIAATALAIFPIILALCTQDVYLSDTQNAVEEDNIENIPYQQGEYTIKSGSEVEMERVRY